MLLALVSAGAIRREYLVTVYLLEKNDDGKGLPKVGVQLDKDRGNSLAKGSVKPTVAIF